MPPRDSAKRWLLPLLAIASLSCAAQNTSTAPTNSRKAEPARATFAIADLACRPDEQGTIQDAIDLEEEDDDRELAGRPSDDWVRAKRLLDQARWSEARTEFLRVARGETRDDGGNRQLAEYYAAAASYRLADFEAVFSGIEPITKQRNHVKYNEAQVYVLKLLEHAPTRERAIDLLPRFMNLYTARRYGSERAKQEFEIALFATGRAWYRRGNARKALAWLASLPPDSAYAGLAAECKRLIRSKLRPSRT